MVISLFTVAVIYGTGVANGAWWWNAQAEGEGTDFRTAWTVVDSQTGVEVDDDELNYRAAIEIRLPDGADFKLVGIAATERVKLKTDRSLECTSTGIEAEVNYRVEALKGAAGDLVKVWVTAGDTNNVLGEGFGDLKENINVEVFIPADNPDCAG